jgi:sterol desaturase/sphingolipid hydroxylase (fatty acid hydroxylase superfamily)
MPGPVTTFAACTAATAFFCVLTATSKSHLAPLFDAAFDASTLIGHFINCGPSFTSEIFLWGLFLPMAVYWIAAWVYMCIDLWLDHTNQYTVPPKMSHPGFRPKLDHGKYLHAIRQSFAMTVFSGFFQMIWFLPLNRFINGQEAICNGHTGWFDAFPAPTDAPAMVLFAATTALRLFALMAITDTWFYVTHRMCHEVPFLYKNVHKLHHTWVEPYAVAATAAHPFEQIVVNVHTVNLPCMLLGAPWRWFLLWFCLAMVNTCTSHSGYDLRFIFGFDGNIAHDRHHHYQLSEFGTNFLCDRFFGTRFQDRYTADGRRKTVAASS